MLNKLERKLGKYAIPHLINYLLIGYGIGYVLIVLQGITSLSFLSFMTLEPFWIINRFQFWRILTWVMIPPFSMTGLLDFFFALIMMFFYWQLGSVLEQQWGTFRFNVYIFGGMIFTVLGAFLYTVGAYLITGIMPQNIGNYISTSYINMSIFLAFAMSFPDMKVYLYFLIPIKMKWMAVVYAVITVYELIIYPWGARIAIFSSLLNFLIFFFATRNYKSIDPRELHRRNEFQRKMRAGQNAAWYTQNGYGSRGENAAGRTGTAQSGARPFHGGQAEIARHKCAICGRTELTNPELEFRFCSKCNGNYEYCQDHLFTHQHKQ